MSYIGTAQISGTRYTTKRRLPTPQFVTLDLIMNTRPILSVAIITLVAWPLSFVSAVRNIRIESPLIALTVWDDETDIIQPETHRTRWLPRFRAGLNAEAKASQAAVLAKKPRLSMERPDWAQQVAASDQRTRSIQTKAMERAYDQAVAKYDEVNSKQQSDNTRSNSGGSKYQFVGVVNSCKNEDDDTPISWYARPKPRHAKWSVRLVHVNKKAIIKDLFGRGKVDVFARYENSGKTLSDTGLPLIHAKYAVRQRSWK
jgi:hypothetical protein